MKGTLLAISWLNDELKKVLYHSIEKYQSYRMIPKNHILIYILISYSEKATFNTFFWMQKLQQKTQSNSPLFLTQPHNKWQIQPTNRHSRPIFFWMPPMTKPKTAQNFARFSSSHITCGQQTGRNHQATVRSN